MPKISQILSQLPPYSGRKLIYQKNQGVSDVIAGISATHGKYVQQYDKIAPQFAGGGPMEVCSKLWHFLKKNCHYVIEPDSAQTLRSPSAILELGKNPNIGLDCKSYSLFIGGCLDALNRKGYNIPWCYRFASYRWYDPMPHHVFVVAFPNTDHEIWIDPVLSSFNQKKNYYFKTDRKMALIGISGVNRRQARQQRRAANRLKPKRQRIREAIQKGKRIAVKFNPATAPARNAFLLIVKLNVFNLARRLNKLIQKQPSKLQAFWEKIGGNYESLVRNINIGAKVKAVPLPMPSANIGVVVAAGTTAAVASATPIIVKIIRLLKEAGIGAEDLAAVAKNVAQKVLSKKLEESDSPEDQMSSNIESEGEASTSAADSMQQTAENIEEATEDNEPAESEDEGVGAINFQSALPLIAIAAGVYFLTRKK